jgi:hypothetical protein
MGRRILNRKELRADFDAAERRKGDDEDGAENEVDAEADEDEEEEKGEADEAEEASEDEEEEAAVAAPKKKKAAKPAKPKSRSRVAKVTRLRLVWGVFNNSHQCVATFAYPKRKEAEAHAAKLTGDKKNTHFVQPVKEPIEEKKEKA